MWTDRHTGRRSLWAPSSPHRSPQRQERLPYVPETRQLPEQRVTHLSVCLQLASTPRRPGCQLPSQRSCPRGEPGDSQGHGSHRSRSGVPSSARSLSPCQAMAKADRLLMRFTVAVKAFPPAPGQTPASPRAPEHLAGRGESRVDRLGPGLRKLRKQDSATRGRGRSPRSLERAHRPRWAALASEPRPGHSVTWRGHSFIYSGGGCRASLLSCQALVGH